MKTQLVQLEHGATESGARASGAFASIATALQQDRSRYGCWDARRFIGVEHASPVGVANDTPFQSSDMVRLVANC